MKWAACCSMTNPMTLLSLIWTLSCSDLISIRGSFTEAITGERVTRVETSWCMVKRCTSLLQSGQAAVSLKVCSTSVLDSLTWASSTAGPPDVRQVHWTQKWTRCDVACSSCAAQLLERSIAKLLSDCRSQSKHRSNLVCIYRTLGVLAQTA